MNILIRCYLLLCLASGFVILLLKVLIWSINSIDNVNMSNNINIYLYIPIIINILFTINIIYVL